jgi:hypothetical protein
MSSFSPQMAVTWAVPYRVRTEFLTHGPTRRARLCRHPDRRKPTHPAACDPAKVLIAPDGTLMRRPRAARGRRRWSSQMQVFDRSSSTSYEPPSGHSPLGTTSKVPKELWRCCPKTAMYTFVHSAWNGMSYFCLEWAAGIPGKKGRDRKPVLRASSGDPVWDRQGNQ